MAAAPPVRSDAPLHEAVTRVAATLGDAGVPSPAVDARWLVEGIVGVDPHRHPDTLLPPASLPALQDAVARRVAREPLQLILGTAPFRSLELACSPGVFVPRPETEIVAGLAVGVAQRVNSSAPVVAEPCTGTGAIACAIAAEVPGARVLATDRDPAAVDLARHNADRVRRGVAGPPGFARAASLTVQTGDLLEPLDPALRGHLDVLVANPPYLPAGDRDSWAPEVADHDPDAALVGGVDGHEVVDRLLALATRWLAPGGTVILEIDERRSADAAAVARDVGLGDVEVARDLTGADRAIVARRPV
jgi:release factor glutamine methyltransferase